MNVHIRTPYSLTKNLGHAYNVAMESIPDGDAACFIDGDVCFLTPNYGHLLHEYANMHPDAVQTCYTNRIHQLAKHQQFESLMDLNSVKDCAILARVQMEGELNSALLPSVCPVSGFLLLIPKHIWQQHKFNEDMKCLGVDNDFTNRIRAAGVPIYLMENILVWHSYRLLTNSKEHLL